MWEPAQRGDVAQLEIDKLELGERETKTIDSLGETLQRGANYLCGENYCLLPNHLSLGLLGLLLRHVRCSRIFSTVVAV